VALNRSFESPESGGFIPGAIVPVAESLFFVVGRIYDSLTLKAQEPGFSFVYATENILSSNTLLALKLTDPFGNVAYIDSSRITAPNSDLITGDPARPTISGGTYMQFITTALDFLIAGVWRVQGLYVEGGIERPGDAVYFVVGDSFYG